MEPKFMKAFVAAMSVLALSSPAFAQGGPRAVPDRGSSNTPSDTARTGDTNAQGERLVCRVVSDSSTSRMASRRVCRTEEQWREMSRSGRD